MRRRAGQFLRDNLGPTFLKTGATLTALTAPPDKIAGPLVQAGGGCLILAGLCVYALKNAKPDQIKLKTCVSLISGLAGLGACVTLGGNGFYQMLHAQGHPNWTAFGGFIAGANVLLFFFGNGGVTVDGVRALKGSSQDHPPTDWNGININYALGGLGLFLAGVSVYPANQEVGKNLMMIGSCFMVSGMAGLTLESMPKTFAEALASTGSAARQATRVFSPHQKPHEPR